MKNSNEQIWLTSALTDSDVANALTLCFSLKRVHTSRKVGIIVSPSVSIALREALHYSFDWVFYLQEDRNKVRMKNADFVLLFALTLTNFTKCVMLTPNTLVLKNSDELFDWAEENGQEHAWTVDQDMSIVVIWPSLWKFNSLLQEFDNNGYAGHLTNVLGSECPTGNYIDDKYNRKLMIDSDKIIGNGNEISIMTLPEELPQDKGESLGIIGQAVLAICRKIDAENVQPLLKAVSTRTLAKLEEHKCGNRNDAVAIIGMSCRYPSANNLEEFWNILVEGKDATGNPPALRWLQEQTTASNKPEFWKMNAGFSKCPVDEFDAKFFGLSPKEMLCLDPQHRLVHELVWEGLEDAAIDPLSLDGTNGGVFFGSWTNDYKDILSQNSSEGFFRKYMGNSIGAGAARISHLLGLTGPSIATESGCSAAMVAVHLACKSLQRGETNLALACGVNLLLKPFDKDEMPMVLSADSRCKTFDAKADGFGRAEGAGVLVLKRVSDAIKDGDYIWGLIRGTGMSQEGVSKSMGTPTIHCESLAMKNALKDANVNPATVSYVEAHGTGTAVGDPLEVAAIAKAYQSKERKMPLLIGSVKTNVGHTESCSGITGIIKVILAMKYETIPAHRNFETLNPAIDLDVIPAEIPLQSVKWLKEQGKPRVAGVSSFGITGTDAHAIIEEPPSLSENNLTLYDFERPLQLLKVSVKTEDALSTLLERYKNHLNTTNDDIEDIAFTANIGRADFGHRAVVIAKSKEDAVKSIGDMKFFQGELSPQGKICFLFTGQGSQYPGMAKRLYETSPVFRMHFEYCANLLRINYNIDITQVLWSEPSSAEISRTIYSQTSIFCVEYSLCKLWESWGVQPDYVLGHSLGEFAAAVCANILSVEDALKLVAERSRLIDELPRGKMLVIKADKERVNKLIKEVISNDKDHLDIAAINSLEQTVVAGDSELIMNLSECCNNSNLKCIILASTHAFHSSHMDAMLESYRKVAKTVKTLKANDCKFISGMRGALVEGEQVDAEYWVEHTREKVLFLKASRKSVKLGCKTFIEVGPQPVLTALTLMNNENESNLLCLPSLKRDEEEWRTLLTTLGKLYVKGMSIDWKGFDRFYNRNKVRLPHYPFIGKKYWPEMVAASGVSLHPLLGSAIVNASSTKLFQAGLNLSALEFIKDHAIGSNVIFPGAGFLEMCLAAGVAAVEGSTDSLTLPTRPMKVENLRIEAPLSLVDTETCQLQTVVEFNESQGNWNDMKVSIFRKRNHSESGKWLSHAKATFCPVPSAEEKELRIDIDTFNATLELSPRNAELTQFYDKVASVGLNFGPTFKSIEKIWRVESTPNGLLAKVKVPATDGQNEYILHPVVLDAMIQTIMILCHGSNIKKKLYVPIRIGQFVWLRKMDPSKDVYIQVSNSAKVSALLVDSSGSVLAEMSSVELVETTVKVIESVLEQQTRPLPQMWEEVWKSGLGPFEHAVDLKKGAGQRFYSDEFETLMKSYNNPSRKLTETFRELESFVYLHILKALYECGWEPELNQRLELDVLAEQLLIKKEFRYYFRFMLETLEAEGILQQKNAGESEGNSTQP